MCMRACVRACLRVCVSGCAVVLCAMNATEVASKKQHVHLSAVDPSLARRASVASKC